MENNTGKILRIAAKGEKQAKQGPPSVRNLVEDFLDRYESGEIQAFGLVFFDESQQMCFWNWFGVRARTMAAIVTFKNMLNNYLKKRG